MKLTPAHVMIFLLALGLVAVTPVKAMNWSLKRYVINPWWQFYAKRVPILKKTAVIQTSWESEPIPTVPAQQPGRKPL